MSELINNYTEHYEKFIDALVQFHGLHLRFLDRQNPIRTRELRGNLKEMRRLLSAMEKIAQARMKERQVEWGQTHPNRLGRGKKDE